MREPLQVSRKSSLHSSSWCAAAKSSYQYSPFKLVLTALVDASACACHLSACENKTLLQLKGYLTAGTLCANASFRISLLDGVGGTKDVLRGTCTSIMLWLKYL